MSGDDSPEFNEEHWALNFILFFVTILAIAVSVQTQCSFLGIAQGLYSIFGRYDCNYFLFRDWVSLSAWTMVTYYAIIAICIEKSPNFKTRTNIFQKWFIITISVVLLEFAAALTLIFFVLYMTYSCFVHRYCTDSTTRHTESKTVAQVQITPEDTKYSMNPLAAAHLQP
jgi:hypothetical protein